MTRRVAPNEIPTIADYSHYNEEAAAVWWAENRYDMENPSERDPANDDDYGRYDREDDPYQASFATEAEARAFMATYDIDERRDTLSEWDGRWIVEHYSDAGQKSYKRSH